MTTALSTQDARPKQKIKIILALAIPAMVENFLQTIVGFVDTLFVAKLGINEVAAVGVTNAIVAVYIAIFMALSVGTSSLIARSIGAGDWSRAKSIARQSTWMAAVVGLVFGLATLIFAEPLLRLMGADDAVVREGVIYFRIVAGPAIFLSLMTVFGSILRASGDTKTPMKVGLWINLVHIVLDYVLIFGIAGIAGWGIAGAAWATTLVRILGTVMLFLYIRKSKLSFSFRKEATDGSILPLLKLSGPAAAERLIMRFGQVLYFGLIIKIGTDVYAAHVIAGNIEIFSYMPGYGLAIAATTLVGQQFGANRIKDAYQYGWLTTGIAVVFMSFVGLLMFIFSPFAAQWFTQDQSIVDMITVALRIDAFAQPFLAVSLVLAGALQGIGDTKSPMYSTAIGMWFIRVLGVYVLCFQWGMGIAGVWLSIALDLFIRAVYLTVRFKKVMGS
ncbi:MATE family efflux transporter [Paenibacillus albicereus]|uniref:Probable multidrug resistance protein NorM n=1 Tax=Paenibacillus albicereus TaxID=2726185 RepID=A0A6H2GYU1_9BACL|nr:MATE family efflux transporter [Paenibacillus albicereus]QJC52346.1 MATE family efflux transporter [Paenibacillus albicereus]